MADADELLVYPGWERLSIPDLCASLDVEGSSAMRCLLTDMYSREPFHRTVYEPGADPLSTCPYFESDSIVCLGSLQEVADGAWRHYGGMRLRLFGLNVRLDKATLFKHHPSMELQEGTHAIKGAKFSRQRGAVLHFKYLMDFPERVAVEAEREEHWSNGIEYKRYNQVVRASPGLTAYADISRRFSGSADLLRSGIMRARHAQAGDG